jgi:hypothetical protein
MLIGRRSFVALGAAVSGASLSRAAAGRNAVRGIDLGNPRVALDCYVKLRGSIAEQTVWQVYEGDIFVAADRQVGIPLCGFRGIQKSAWKRDGKGGYRQTDYDIGFYVDYQTRQILSTWRNPLTDREVEVFHYRSGPSGGHFALGAADGDVYGGPAGRWMQLGDQIWHTSANWGERESPMKPEEWPLASSGRTLPGSMSLSFAGRVSEIADPALSCPRTLQLWTNCAAWMPWMEMGQRPGFNLWRWVGAKGLECHELPPELVTAAQAVWPGYVARDSVWQVPTSGRVDYMRIKRGLKPTL